MSKSNNKLNDLINRELEYKKLNEKLERESAALVKETENVMEKHERFMQSPNFSNAIEPREKLKSNRSLISPSHKIADNANKSLIASTNLGDSGLNNFKNTMEPLDFIPPSINDMTLESQIRFYRAKLMGMNNDIKKLTASNNSMDSKLKDQEKRLREAEEFKQRFQKASSGQDSQIDKLKKTAMEFKEKYSNAEIENVVLKKEVDNLKKSEKHLQTIANASDVKLNKSLEECEQLKTQMNKIRTEIKEQKGEETTMIDELTNENKKLEKQKQELLNAFKKQMKLIDIYKRQQMHMEACKLMSITEEEFSRMLPEKNFNI